MKDTPTLAPRTTVHASDVAKSGPVKGHVHDKISVFEALAKASEQTKPEGRVKKAVNKIEAQENSMISASSFHKPVSVEKHENAGDLSELINRNTIR